MDSQYSKTKTKKSPNKKKIPLISLLAPTIKSVVEKLDDAEFTGVRSGPKGLLLYGTLVVGFFSDKTREFWGENLKTTCQQTMGGWLCFFLEGDV